MRNPEYAENTGEATPRKVEQPPTTRDGVTRKRRKTYRKAH